MFICDVQRKMAEFNSTRAAETPLHILFHHRKSHISFSVEPKKTLLCLYMDLQNESIKGSRRYSVELIRIDFCTTRPVLHTYTCRSHRDVIELSTPPTHCSFCLVCKIHGYSFILQCLFLSPNYHSPLGLQEKCHRRQLLTCIPVHH